MTDLIRRQSFDETKSAVVILTVLDAIQGGVSLDMTGFAPGMITAGHVIISDDNGVAKPLGVTGNKFDALPADHKFLGICLTDQIKGEPFVGVLLQGAVNYKAMPYSIEDISNDLRVALNNINFRSDK